MYLGKGVLKICSEFTGEDLCRSVIAIKLLCNFIEITLRHGCSPFNLLHIFRTLFPQDTSERLLLKSDCGITFTPKLNLVIIIFTILVKLLQQVYVISFLMFQSLCLYICSFERYAFPITMAICQLHLILVQPGVLVFITRS